MLRGNLLDCVPPLDSLFRCLDSVAFLRSVYFLRRLATFGIERDHRRRLGCVILQRLPVLYDAFRRAFPWRGSYSFGAAPDKPSV